MKKLKLFLGVVLAMSIFASTGVMAAEKTITVSGSGKMLVTPDIAYLNAGVNTKNSNAEAASKENIATTQKLVAKLKEMGIDEKDIKTENYFVSPVYDYSNEKGEPTITGYEVMNSVNITIRDINSVGKIVDSSIAAGANVMNGLNFSVSDSSKYYEPLYKKAFEDANKKANAIAAAMGVSISAPVNVSDSNIYTPVEYRSMSIDLAKQSEAAVNTTFAAPGEMSIEVGITVSYNY